MNIIPSLKKIFTIYNILLFGLLVTFIVFIIQYMEGTKKNFWDINVLLIVYSAILIVPFCYYILNILKGKNLLTKYAYQLIVLIFYIINTSMYGSLNHLHPIKGDIISSIFHILFIIISILLNIIVFGITSEFTNVEKFFNKVTKNMENKWWLLIFSIVLLFVNFIVFYFVTDKKNNHTVDT